MFITVQTGLSTQNQQTNMPILNDITPLTPAQEMANTLKGITAGQFRTLLQSWIDGMQLLWGNPDNTADILEALGTEAAELFQLSANTVQFLETLKPGCTTASLSMMRPFTVHQDGTVTLN